MTSNLDNVKLEAAVLDPAISAMGFVLTCSATVEGSGVELELGAGEKMYEVSASNLREGRRIRLLGFNGGIDLHKRWHRFT